MTIKDFLRRRIAFHAPMIDGSFGDQSDGIERNPLPENDIVRHHVGFHLGFHFNVENLKRFLSFQRNHFRRRIHDGRIGGNGTTNRVSMISHVNDDHLVVVAHFFADAYEFVGFHGEAVEADVGGANAHIGELKKQIWIFNIWNNAG